MIFALFFQPCGSVTTTSRPPTSGTVGTVPSQTGAFSMVSPALNSVTFSNCAKPQSSMRSASSLRARTVASPLTTTITRRPPRSALTTMP